MVEFQSYVTGIPKSTNYPVEEWGITISGGIFNQIFGL